MPQDHLAALNSGDGGAALSMSVFGLNSLTADICFVRAFLEAASSPAC